MDLSIRELLHKETSVRFLDFYMRTVPLSVTSTGENHSVTAWKLFDKFIMLPENEDLKHKIKLTES